MVMVVIMVVAIVSVMMMRIVMVVVLMMIVAMVVMVMTVVTVIVDMHQLFGFTVIDVEEFVDKGIAVVRMSARTRKWQNPSQRGSSPSR